MTNLEIGMRIYLKGLQYLIKFTVVMCLVFMIPTIVFNSVLFFFVFKEKGSEYCQYEFIEEKILWCILIYPSNQNYTGWVMEVHHSL